MRNKTEDPCELISCKENNIKIGKMPSSFVSERGLPIDEVWEFSKRKITDKNGNILLRSSESANYRLAEKIEEFLSDEKHLEKRFGGKRPTDAEISKRANFSTAKWNRITGVTNINIEKGNVFSIAIALKLDCKQTEELLKSAGYLINYELELDSAIMYFIKREIYDVALIYDTLSCFSDIKNGLDRFSFSKRR